MLAEIERDMLVNQTKIKMTVVRESSGRPCDVKKIYIIKGRDTRYSNGPPPPGAKGIIAAPI